VNHTVTDWLRSTWKRPLKRGMILEGEIHVHIFRLHFNGRFPGERGSQSGFFLHVFQKGTFKDVERLFPDWSGYALSDTQPAVSDLWRKVSAPTPKKNPLAQHFLIGYQIPGGGHCTRSQTPCTVYWLSLECGNQAGIAFRYIVSWCRCRLAYHCARNCNRIMCVFTRTYLQSKLKHVVELLWTACLLPV